jgi:hypothetical protein
MNECRWMDECELCFTQKTWGPCVACSWVGSFKGPMYL